MFAPPPSVLHAAAGPTFQLAALPIGGEDSLLNGVALAAMASLVVASVRPDMVTPLLAGTQLSEREQPDQCYPIDMEDCETCEYSEEMSDYYGEPIWFCAQ